MPACPARGCCKTHRARSAFRATCTSFFSLPVTRTLQKNSQAAQTETVGSSGPSTALGLLKRPSMNTSASSALVEPPQPPQPTTLLIVEADAVFREFEARTLSDRGYTVLKARGMAQALRLSIGSAAIHLLLVEFPRLSADFPELTQQFRAMHPAAPVLLMLGAFEEFDEGLHNLGRIRVMAKPFKLDELITNVHRSLTQTAPLPCQRPVAAGYDWQYQRVGDALMETEREPCAAGNSRALSL